MRELDSISEALQQLAERLADAGIDLLAQAVHSEEPERVRLAGLERQVAKARRAVEKAVAELS